MPARLKSFELHGYKTFASRNEFIFSDGITAIVGPNGSGKSNIADALRWVLGEQSFSLLRAKKTEDMIFSGSENRPRAGMASATIVFDNSDGWLPIEFTEVGITRRAYRDGENEYLLNGQRVRLKDVSEVLAKSGLAERTYTIIGQGLVDAALALKAEDRRRLFEEAAGIGLQRARREEAIKRLEATNRNLERVQDILAELQPHLRNLERQAKRAQEYNQMRADLKVVLREWYGYHWHKAQSELRETQINAKQSEEELAKMQSNQLHLDQELSSFRLKIKTVREELNNWHRELSSLHQRREGISREQAISNERLRSLLQQLDQLSAEKIKITEEITKHQDQLEISRQELERLSNELNEARQSSLEVTEVLKVRQNERAVVEERIKTLQGELIESAARSEQLLSRQIEKEIHVEQLRAILQNIEKNVNTEEVEITSFQNKYNSLVDSKNEKTETSSAIQHKLILVQGKLTDLEQEHKDINEKISGQKTLIAQLQAEINVLEDAEQNLTGYQEGARILLQAVKDKRLDGAIGSLGNSMNVPEEFETAIAAILGEYIDALVIESMSQTEKALDLIESETVRGSILPLDTISPLKPLLLDLEKAPVNRENIFGVAANLVKADAKLLPIINLLFGQVIIVKDRKTARTIISSHDWRNMANLRVVTLKGEMYLANGPIVRGASGKGLLVRPRKRRETKSILEEALSLENEYEGKRAIIENKISTLQAKEIEYSDKFQKSREAEKTLNNQMHQIELQIQKIQQSLQWHRDQVKQYQGDIEKEINEQAGLKAEIETIQIDSRQLKLDLDRNTTEMNSSNFEELITQNTYWITNIAVIDRALANAGNQLTDKENQYHQLEVELADVTMHVAQLEVEIKTLKEKIAEYSSEEIIVASKIEELSNIVNPQEEQLSTLENSYNDLISSDAEARQALRASEQHYTQAKINLVHRQESLESLRSHIEDDFGLVSFEYIDSVSGPKPLPLEGMVEELPKVEVLSAELEETIRLQKAQIRRMGAINPEAQNEYQEVRERYEFLTSQVEDLMKAEGDIKEVISELDLLMEREFRRTFDVVAQEFKQIFTRLFGGGSAKLSLTDPDNITDTGIDIEARLPGRREQGLALLSGGERSLTATALVFALLRVSPTPFCILDEVDAMLDEANVGRFRDLLTELCEKTQFIIITHNRNTVQAASIIYGITMGRDSASQVISLRMDQLGEEFGL